MCLLFLSAAAAVVSPPLQSLLKGTPVGKVSVRARLLRPSQNDLEKPKMGLGKEAGFLVRNEVRPCITSGWKRVFSGFSEIKAHAG